MQTSTPIIDMHCHTAGIGAGGSGCFVSLALRRNMRYRFFLKAFGVSEAELEQHGDKLVLERLSHGLEQSRHVAAAVVLLTGFVGVCPIYLMLRIRTLAPAK